MNDYSDYWKEHWLSHSKLDSSDPQKQVARTKFGIPISENDWNRTCDYIVDQMQLQSTDTALDLCCGNGLLSAHLIDYVNKIYAVDYSKKLLDSFVVESDKITKVLSDVLSFDYYAFRFNRVVMYFAAQHFSESTLLSIVRKVHKNLEEGGVFLIGDIPNMYRKWSYFYKPEFRHFYFSNLERGEPSVGTWYDKKFFEYLAEYIGFGNVEILDQPEFMTNSNHRFDVLFKK